MLEQGTYFDAKEKFNLNSELNKLKTSDSIIILWLISERQRISEMGATLRDDVDNRWNQAHIQILDSMLDHIDKARDKADFYFNEM